jgi:hypothetical protein
MYIYASARRASTPRCPPSSSCRGPLLLIVNLKSIREEHNAELQSRKVDMKR